MGQTNCVCGSSASFSDKKSEVTLRTKCGYCPSGNGSSVFDLGFPSFFGPPPPSAEELEECGEQVKSVTGIQIKFGANSWDCCEIVQSSQDQIKKLADVLVEFETRKEKSSAPVGVKITAVSERLPWKQWKTEEHGVLLSLIRARAVRDALVEQGVKNPISVEGLGSLNNKGSSMEFNVAMPAEIEKEIRLESKPSSAPTFTDMERAQEKLDEVLKQPIPFGGGNTNLSSTAEAIIKNIADVLNEFPQYGMKTIGYTGGVSNPMELSMGRCKKVREALQKHGVKNPMSAKGMGNKDNNPRVVMVMADAAEVEAEAQAEPQKTPPTKAPPPPQPPPPPLPPAPVKKLKDAGPHWERWAGRTPEKNFFKPEWRGGAHLAPRPQNEAPKPIEGIEPVVVESVKEPAPNTSPPTAWLEQRSRDKKRCLCCSCFIFILIFLIVVIAVAVSAEDSESEVQCGNGRVDNGCEHCMDRDYPDAPENPDECNSPDCTWNDVEKMCQEG